MKQDIVNKDNKLRDINNKYNDSLSKIKQLQSQVDIYSASSNGKITIDETEYTELKVLFYIIILYMNRIRI